MIHMANDEHVNGAQALSIEDAPERAVKDATARGLNVEFLAREGTGRPTGNEFGGAPIVKTIVVRRGDSFVFVLTPLDMQFSWPKLRAYLGVNKLSLPDADEAFAATGYKRGTITPLGATTAWPVVLDASLADRAIVVGSGMPSVGARVQAPEFIRAYEVDVLDLSSSKSNWHE